MDNRKGTEMNKVYIVYGDDGFDGHGAVVYGMYPTESAAAARVADLERLYEAGEDGNQFLGYRMVEVGAGGSDFRLQIGG
jgi:hypothetical protein